MKHDILEKLYIEHYRAAYLYTYSLCHNKETAEDIVSSAFEKALLALEDDVPSFAWWLLKVCRNLWIDQTRKSKHLSAIPIDELSLAQNLSIASDLIRKQKNQLLYSAIQHLPERECELLTLHYFSDIPLTQIAKMTGEAYTTIKTRLHRSRLKLKKYLEEVHYHDF